MREETSSKSMPEPEFKRILDALNEQNSRESDMLNTIECKLMQIYHFPEDDKDELQEKQPTSRHLIDALWEEKYKNDKIINRMIRICNHLDSIV